MKKLSVIILSILLSVCVCLPVMALDLDLIEELEKEEIKDDYKEEENEEYIEPEPTPELTHTTEEPTVIDNAVSDNDITVSWNSVSENLISIENEIRRLRTDVQSLANTTFSVSISNNNVSDNQVITLSEDIIHKPLKEYSTSESMSLIGLMLAFTGLIVYVVHKSIYRWRR